MISAWCEPYNCSCTKFILLVSRGEIKISLKNAIHVFSLLEGSYFKVFGYIIYYMHNVVIKSMIGIFLQNILYY